MSKLEKIRKSENYILLKKYISLSFLGYFYVFLFLYIFVDFFQINKALSFLLAYGSWYIVLYVLQLKYLFNKKHDRMKFFRFYLRG